MAPADSPGARRRPATKAPPVHVAPYADEGPCVYTVTTDAGGVKLHGLSHPAHVDERGITWEPWGGTQTGGQEHGHHHPVRQPLCMEDLLCGRCGGQPDRHPELGCLWVLSASDLPEAWPCTILTTTPPFCDPCARQAVRDCHALRDGFARVRATTSEIVGVAGDLHLPGREPEERVVLFDDGALPYVVARQLVLRIEDARLDLEPADVPPRSGIATVSIQS